MVTECGCTNCAKLPPAISTLSPSRRGGFFVEKCLFDDSGKTRKNRSVAFMPHPGNAGFSHSAAETSLAQASNSLAKSLIFLNAFAFPVFHRLFTQYLVVKKPFQSMA
ncbi:hypothetical protein G3A56_01440 [Rhizobium oryzihabitans]|uniref:Uncharacterized protein n=1 Tax=Rhizobium oryzihabitans TaxID=2267833 RepID=A0A7L5BDL5_9HYPH|nr:hypothetical protein G3A56_01440 [Rhizobium oryzihabitans]